MAQQGQPQIPIQPQDPQTQIEEHVKYRRRQQISNNNLVKLISENLSDFQPIMNGKSHAFTALKIRNAGIKQLTDVIKEYQHLRKIDLSLNLLKEIPNLLNLRFVISLDLSRNLLTNATFLSRESNFPYVKDINLLGNKVTQLPAIMLKSLRRLNLNLNLVSSLQDFDGHTILQILQLRSNKIKSLKGLKNVPQLRQLYVADNQLTNFKQIQHADNLEKINARKNKIANLSQFPNLPRLVYINLRENQIAKVNDLTGIVPNVKTINLLGCPIQAQLADNTKKQVWMRFRHFNRINKNQITNEQRQEFDKQYKDRLAVQQRQRLEKQTAQRQAREQQQREKQGA